MQAVAPDLTAKARHRQNPMADFSPRARDAGEEILAELRAVNHLLAGKTTPDEPEPFHEWLKAAAQPAATAAKEGGFLGFRAERVTEHEQQMLDRLAEVFHSEGE